MLGEEGVTEEDNLMEEAGGLAGTGGKWSKRGGERAGEDGGYGRGEDRDGREGRGASS